MLSQRTLTNSRSICESFSPWENHLIPGLDNSVNGPFVVFKTQKGNCPTLEPENVPSRLPFITVDTTSGNQSMTTFTLIASAPFEKQERQEKEEKEENFFGNRFWSGLSITWTMVPQKGSNGSPCWITVDHFSMLSIGWIPKDKLEFVIHFLSNLCERWLKLCDRAEKHLSIRVN